MPRVRVHPAHWREMQQVNSSAAEPQLFLFSPRFAETEPFFRNPLSTVLARAFLSPSTPFPLSRRYDRITGTTLTGTAGKQASVELWGREVCGVVSLCVWSRAPVFLTRQPHHGVPCAHLQTCLATRGTRGRPLSPPVNQCTLAVDFQSLVVVSS